MKPTKKMKRKNKDTLSNEDDLKNYDDLQNWDDLKNQDGLKIKMTQKWRQPQKWEWDEQRLKRCFGSIPWTWLIWEKNPDFFTTYNVSVSWQFLLSDHCFNPQRRCPGNTEYCQKGANAYNIWYFQNPNSTSTQQQFNQSWVSHENDFANYPTHPTTTETQCP